jgi:hypothetical protein
MTVHGDHGASSESETDVWARLREIRARLPGQLRRERLATAAMTYGALCSLDELHARIARTLPRRLGYVRRTSVVTIERSEIAIPDHVLLTYDDAVRLAIFARFLVLTPAYYLRQQTERWLVAEVAGTERWTVVARWRDGAPGEARRVA